MRPWGDFEDLIDQIGELEARNEELEALNAELLAVLKRLSEKSPCPDKYDKRWTEAEAAIAKAEGRGP